MSSRFIFKSMAALVAAPMLLLQAAAAETPRLDDASGRLQMPAVSLANQPGAFQDIELEYVQDDLWRVVQVREGVLITDIQTVEYEVVQGRPLQVFVRVSGEFPSGCPQLGQVQVERADNRFNIAVYYKNTPWLENPEEWACTLAIVPFSVVIPLPVYDLEAGAYEYVVNDKFAGSFMMPEKNSL